MWSNYALALYRTLSRHRLYAALNVLGLALGIAVCAILLSVVRFEAGFDRWIPHANDIYRINRTSTMSGRPSKPSADTQPVLLPALLLDFPQIRSAVRIMDSTGIVRSGERSTYEKIAFADSSLFDVFALPLAAGDAKTALADDSSLVMSQSMARKYFGTDHPLGRVLTLVLDGKPHDYRVTGVLRDLPVDTHLKLDLIARFDPNLFPIERGYFTSWGSSMLYSYVQLRSPADARAMQAAMPAFIDRRVDNDVRRPPSRELSYSLMPITAAHFYDARIGGAFKPGVDPLFIGALAVMGLVTLLIAIVNYISLATARAGMRAREVALRKVVGATRRALIVQFVCEAVALALAAGLIAASLVEVCMPGVSAVLGEPIRLSYFGSQGFVPPLAGLCLVVGLISGLYPAFVLAGFRPAAVLASARSPGGGRAGARVRAALTILQFSIAITLMICTAVIFRQIQFVRTADLGFRRDGLVIVNGLSSADAAPRSRSIMQAFRDIPGVIDATASDRYPATDNESTTNVKRLSNPSFEPDITTERIGADYARTYGLHLIAGRVLGSQQRVDDMASWKGVPPSDWQLNVMINASAARAFGFADPAKAVGQKVAFGRTDAGKSLVATIVGVVDDVRFLSPRKPAPPQIYMQDTRIATTLEPDDWSAAVRVPEADRAEITRQIEHVWRSLVPGVPFRAQSVQAALNPYYDPEERRGQLFAAGAVLSGFIACLGLYGLAAFNTTRRFKEIGIRKTLGASTRDVMRLLIGEFLKPVILANLIAWPLAWFAMRAWLAGFDQRIALNPAYFVAPTLAAALVAVLTVGDQAFRVARAEPAVALRYE